jgi:hypothetical protein
MMVRARLNQTRLNMDKRPFSKLLRARSTKLQLRMNARRRRHESSLCYPEKKRIAPTI